MISWIFIVLALVTLAGAGGVMLLRNLVHCALCLAITFAGLAGMYLQLGAQFIGLVQVLVYIGAVAVLILFALLLTRAADPPETSFAPGWRLGVGTALGVFGVMVAAVAGSRIHQPAPVAVEATVRHIGELLMGKYVLPLQVTGLLLTAALVGGIIVALRQEGQ